ncbi:MAG: multidrug efflux RND transporter permease subunit [Phycisphaeraceae bacterium]
MFSKFFIDRPVFACVLSLLVLLVGGVAIVVLPVAQYPEITPPTIRVSASYPGADAQTVAEAVAGPIEQELSGVQDLIYFNSQSGNDGSLSITATFEIGTDQDLAAVEVQNRVSAAESRLPEEVARQGVSVTKSASSILGLVALQSSNPRYDDVALANYATINLLDDIRRVPGVGDAIVFGAGEYSMRIWVDPDRLAVKNMTVSDVATAIREQNAVFPAGQIGQRPIEGEIEMTIPVITRGRLSEPAEYENIILRANPDGSIVRLKDVARVELGAQSYNNFARVNTNPAAMVMINLQTGANALNTMEGVRQALDAASANFPSGVTYTVSHDTTEIIDESIHEVVATLFEAVGLVLVVVFIFLQSWRATLIPLLAVPVALVGTFAGMLLLGFSINTLTLFGLVLAIGIVVDDAIIVVENVERILAEEKNISVRDATVKAMGQVAGPVITIVLVLSAVFVPVAFMGGITGQLYQQFAITIALSVAISGLVALTLSPALCRLLLKPSHGSKWFFFRWFDRGFNGVTTGYTKGVGVALRHAVISIILFGGLGFVAYEFSQQVPTSFLPEEDQGYFMSAVLLPDGASLQRTDEVIRRAEKFFTDHPAVESVTALGGYDFLSGGTISGNAGAMFVILKPFEDRQELGMSVQEVIADTYREMGDAPEGMVLSFNPPSVPGLGLRAGFQMELQSRGGETPAELAQVSNEFIAAAEQHPVLEGMTGTLRIATPQLFADLDRDRAKMMGVGISEVFESLQAYLGALYVNDFNSFGRIWRVQMQAEAEFRDQPQDIERIFVRNSSGEMVPLSGLVDVSYRTGPNVVPRFNGFSASQITGAPAPGYSTGEAMAAVDAVAAETLPEGYAFEWSGVSYQEVQAGNQAPIILTFGLVIVFLVLAAQYESWSLPVTVLLSVPFAVLGALLAIMMRGLTQDVYFQIGLLTLVGLSAKNAILIIEFCVTLREEGKPLKEAAIEAARLRFRPIIMTSLAFILGVVPMASSTGAGSAARHSIGTGVIGGMLAATFLAPLFVPLFFVLIQGASEFVLGRTRSTEEEDDNIRGPETTNPVASQ